MKILITGATGFVGRHVVQQAVDYGLDVVVTGLSHQEAESLSWYHEVIFLVCNLMEQREDWYGFLGSPDMVIHLAWAGLPQYMSMHHIEDNYWSSYRLLKTLIQSGVQDLTVAGTCFEYGLQEGEISETTCCRPVTAYGRAKHMLHESLQALKQHYEFSYKWPRIFYPYGAGSPRSLLGQLNQALAEGKPFPMSLGEQIRDYLPVETVGKYIFEIAMQNTVYGAINCCSGQSISVRRFVEDYLKQRGKSVELKLGEYPMPSYEPLAFWGNTRRMQRALDAFQDL